jgi:hypothetical protein
MKSIYLLILSICLIISCKKEDSSPNQLLKNTDMESDPSSDQSWFNFGYGTGFTPSWTDEESFSPVHSFKIYRTTIDIDTNHFWGYGQKYSGKIPVGRDLTLKAKIKGVSLSGAGASIVIRCDGAQPGLQFETTEGAISINGNFNWTTYTLNLSQVKSNVTSIMVYLIYLYNTTGAAYFDDVTLTYN